MGTSTQPVGSDGARDSVEQMNGGTADADDGAAAAAAAAGQAGAVEGRCSTLGSAAGFFGGSCDDERVFGFGRCVGMRAGGGELSFSRGVSTL